jgi:hypothetical protein
VVLERVAAILHGAETSITVPFLAAALALCGAMAAYHGLIRRRVAQTIGQVGVTLAMIVGGMWAIVEPAGSVGVLAGWVDKASVGALGVAAAGTPEHAARTLASSMRDLFDDTITAPWCYMEFGDVAWCMQPRRLDAGLRRAGLLIAAQQRALAHSPGLPGGQAQALSSSAALLEGSDTNGAIFLALPANGPARNAINSGGSLLSVLCGGSADATACQGATAAQAQFRTQQGTWARAVGLLLIWLGALGMLALVGWITMRLLAAAVIGLMCLLLAPVAVLAPALGDSGRSLFAAWAVRLVGSLTAKLIYSLLLGAVLLVLHALMALTLLGWWVQWCVISALWWITFVHRRELLGALRVGEHAPWRGGDVRPGLLGRLQTVALYRASSTLAGGARRRPRGPTGTPPTGPAGPAPRGPVPKAPLPRYPADPRTAAALEREHVAAQQRIGGAVGEQGRISALREQLQRVQSAAAGPFGQDASPAERQSGRPGAGRRRQLKLATRAQRLQGLVDAGERRLARDRDIVGAGERAKAAGGHVFTALEAAERGRFYDAQALLGAKGRAGPHGRRRDYTRLASLAGHDEGSFQALRGAERLRAILRVDHELAQRPGSPPPAADDAVRAGRRDGHAARMTERDRRQSEIARDRDRLSPADRRGPAMPTRAGAGALGSWLQEERSRSVSGVAPRPLAERAAEELGRRVGGAAGAARQAPPELPAARRRRQFGAGDDRPQRP